MILLLVETTAATSRSTHNGLNKAQRNILNSQLSQGSKQQFPRKLPQEVVILVLE